MRRRRLRISAIHDLALTTAIVVLLCATAASAITATPAAASTPARRGDLGTKEIRLRVFDASRGSDSAVAGARVRVSLLSEALATDDSGAVAFTVFLRDTSRIEVSIDAIEHGFYPHRQTYGGLMLWYAPLPLMLGLQPGFCAGDCNRDGTVCIDELITGIGVALNEHPPDACDAIDANLDDTVPIDELIAAIDNALHGCAREATPTPTASPMPSPTLCGNAAVIARYPACRASRTEADCTAAGGTWGIFPFSRRPGCFCPTGQAGCPCTDRSQCLGLCRSDHSINDCDSAESGSCSGTTPQAGCWCVFDDGRARGYCWDP